ncbi:MAG: acyltransferase [Eubacteriales bacterium]
MQQAGINRNLGLDMVRSTAILLVLLSHIVFFHDFPFMPVFGVLGVEIFFVLSGFLIGRIIIQNLVENPTGATLKNFYIRRWFRTLPLYYLILVVKSIVTHTGIPVLNFFFIQNFNEGALNFLPVSWSLSIEEWFYLLFPFILLIAIKLLQGRMQKKTIFFIVAVSFLLASFLLRTYTVLAYNPTWDLGIRKQIFLRLDTIMFGVLLAGIKIYYKELYAKFAASKAAAIISCVGFVAIILYFNLALQAGASLDGLILDKILLFTFLPVTCFFFVAWLETSRAVNTVFAKNRLSVFFVFISAISYALYLVHDVVFFYMMEKVPGLRGYALSLGLSVLIAFLLHKFYERPVMNLRDRIPLRAAKKSV